MDSVERVETVDVDTGRWIQLEFGRKWPKYTVLWSVRRRVGDADYPVVSGVVDSMPPPAESAVEEMWLNLRERALTEAQNAVDAEGDPEPEADQPRSFLNRLFGRT